MIITTTIILFIILTIATFIRLKIRRISQESSILFAFLGIMAITFVLGMVNLLGISIYVIYFITALCFIYNIVTIIKKKIKLKNIFTLPVLFYVIILYVFSIVLVECHYRYFDEYSFWGSNLKVMLEKNVFWNNAIYDGVHQTYPPLAGIIEYIFIKILGTYRQDIAIFSITAIVITGILPVTSLYKSYKWKNAIKILLIYLISIVTIFILRGTVLSILIDTILGILFFIGMYSVYKNDNKILIALICISLSLIKNVGIILACTILLFAFIKNVILGKNKKRRIKDVTLIVITLVLIVVSYVCWTIQCIYNNKKVDERHDKNSVDTINIQDFMNALLHKNTTERCEKTYARYTNILKQWDMIEKVPHSTILNIYLLINVLLVIAIIKSKNKKREIALWLSINIGAIIYSLSILATFMFGFTEYQGVNCMGIERYFSTYLITGVLMGVILLIEHFKKQDIIIILCILALLAPQVDYKGIKKYYKVSVTYNSSNFMSFNVRKINKYVPENEKIFLIMQNSETGAEFRMLRHNLSPRTTNLLYEWRIIEQKDPTGEIGGIGKQDFIELIKQEGFKYVYIATIDNFFINEMLDMFDKDFSEDSEAEIQKYMENKIFKVNYDNDGKIKMQLYR